MHSPPLPAAALSTNMNAGNQSSWCFNHELIISHLGKGTKNERTHKGNIKCTNEEMAVKGYLSQFILKLGLRGKCIDDFSFGFTNDGPKGMVTVLLNWTVPTEQIDDDIFADTIFFFYAKLQEITWTKTAWQDRRWR